jgi:type IV pilus assembly protein PilW
MGAAKTSTYGRAQRGFSLIEMMVGVVIGLIAILVVYQVFAAAEGIKRNTTSVGDAQQNGLLSSFILGIELANAGNGVAAAARDLGVCPGAVGPSATAFASTWRPIPLMIVSSGADDQPDTFMVNYSVTSAAIAPAPFTATAAASADYPVQSPTGFQANDLIVAVGGSPAASGCAASKVTAVTAPDVNGVVTVSHGPATAAATFGSGASLFNMGPSTGIQKVRYDITPAFVLRSTSLLKSDATPNDETSPPPNPLASNIVNMKLQYGLDTDGDGVIEWTSATAAGWTPEALMSTTSAQDLIAQLKKLKAVRIGLVVRGEQWDRDAPDVPWSLFGGVYSGTFARAGGNYRYRTYETVIPIRNELWNPL